MMMSQMHLKISARRKPTFNYIRHFFYQRKQNNQEGEHFDQFLTETKKLSKSCEFDTQEEAKVRTRLVFGIFTFKHKGW